MISPKSYYSIIPSGPATQGDIWTNLPFLAHDIPFHLGLLITPKCDFAHQKTEVFNYVPAIAFEEYLTLFGYSRIISEEVNRQRDVLLGINLPCKSISLLEIGVPEAEVLSIIKSEMPDNRSSNSKVTSQYEKFEKTVFQLEKLYAFLQEKNINKNDIAEFLKSKDILKHREKIIKNQIVDVHFLPPCPPVIEYPLVLLLRYIHTCPIELLTAALNAVNDTDWVNRCNDYCDTVKIFNCCRQKPDRILRLRSPYLENMMNRIALVYMRIGIPDFPKSEFDTFMKGAD